MKTPRSTDPFRNFSRNPLIVRAPYSPAADPAWWGGRAMDSETSERRRARSAEAALARAARDDATAAAELRAACGHVFEWPTDGAGRRKPRPEKRRRRRAR